MPIKPGTERLREMAREHEFAFYDYSGRPETGYAVFVSAPVGIFCGYVLTEAKAKLMVELLNERAADFAEKVVRDGAKEIASILTNDLDYQDAFKYAAKVLLDKFGLADGREEKKQQRG